MFLTLLAVATAVVPLAHEVLAASNSPREKSGFAPTIVNTVPAPGPAPDGMVWIPGGEFSMGTADPRGFEGGGMLSMLDARPIHRVYVDGFWMDATDVTNEEFARFIKTTGYITIAERTPTQEEFPDAPAENLIAGSIVFSPHRTRSR